LPKIYDPRQTEDKWYKYWLENDFFHSVPDEREPYTIVIPPPNVTGVLHMGHMLNNTIQDILIRRARMQGKNACWVPGTDHASIATEAKVVQMLREKGIKKSDLSREEFLKYAWEWKEKYGGIILEQLKKLGASCDWERTRFTMEESLSEAVIGSFIKLYNKGLIYRGLRMINWDPQAKTTLSNEEVIYHEEKNTMYYVKYMVKGSDNFIPVATVRPETIMGDVAVCVNPNDPRYKKLVGKTVIVPMVNREVPVIADEYVDMEFGTGALKITPAHDVNDYEIGKKHNLLVIDCFNEDGTIAEAALIFVGEDRFKARKLAVEKLKEDGVLIKSEDYLNKVGRSERTNAVVEPRLSLQWFVSMKDISKPALDNVLNGNITLIPDKYINTYRHWMENVHDWCISRQLWWGQRIPAWYNEKGELVAVARTREEAAKIAGNDKIKQDEDVLDTWFSSWLWPITVFDGFNNPDNKDFKYYYPTNDLVTAPEILFFWVARMIIAGYEFAGDKPFSNVYLTGIVRDKLGRKMSKSLGNSPEPLELITKYGADGVRMGMLICSPAGNDLPFDEGLCEQGRNFCNKIWNVLRLIQGWDITDGTNIDNAVVIEWIESKFNITIAEVDASMQSFRLSEALMKIYKFIWDDFCSWYLELIKPDYLKPIDSFTYNRTIDIFQKLMRVLHPFMPFITEEIWHYLAARKTGESISLTNWPAADGNIDETLIQQADICFQIITNIRDIRAKANKKNSETVDAFYIDNGAVPFHAFQTKLIKLARLDKLEKTNEELKGVKTFIVGGYKFFISTGEMADADAERKKLLEELEYTKGFLASIERKLSNEKFTSSAPVAVVEGERKKKEDALKKISILEQSLL